MNTRREKIRNQIFMLTVLVIAAIGYFFYSQPTSAIHFSAEDSTITFTGPHDTSVSFLLSEVTALSYIEDPEYGEPIDGGTLPGGNLYGIWKSPSLDDFQAYVTTKIPSCILISDGKQTAVFNHSNQDTTYSLFEQLEQYIQGLENPALQP